MAGKNLRRNNISRRRGSAAIYGRQNQVDTEYLQVKIHLHISSILHCYTQLPFILRLPKVEAFMTEVSRCNTIATLTVPHKCVKDTELNGYFIPKDAMLLISVWTVLQDKSIWGDPENFRPERFLDSEGNFKKELASRVPIFGIGK